MACACACAWWASSHVYGMCILHVLMLGFTEETCTQVGAWHVHVHVHVHGMCILSRVWHALGLPACTQLGARRRIGCAHSSYMWNESAPGEAGTLAAARVRCSLEPRFLPSPLAPSHPPLASLPSYHPL